MSKPTQTVHFINKEILKDINKTENFVTFPNIVKNQVVVTEN